MPTSHELGTQSLSAGAIDLMGQTPLPTDRMAKCWGTAERSDRRVHPAEVTSEALSAAQKLLSARVTHGFTRLLSQESAQADDKDGLRTHFPY
ncbi:hypothetical protein PRNP1_004948 [Phytophthora ramorum]